MRSRWQLSTLIPAILLLAFTADAACRWVPLRWLAFRGWEALMLRPTAFGPFQRNRQFHNPRSYGDLAALGNLPQQRVYRTDDFRTDALGFRNPPHAGLPDVLLLGSSFTAGAGVPDADTLAAQLERASGQVVYNAGGAEIELARLRRLTQAVGMSRGLVVCELLERNDVPPVPATVAERRALVPWLWEPWRDHVRDRLRVSPLRLLAQRGCKALHDDVVMPNWHASRVVQRTLRNGAPMLFQPVDVARFGIPRPTEHAADYYAWLRDELRREHLDLLVLLVPDKYSVYGPLQAEPAATADVDYLAAVEQRLRSADVPVLNLAPLLRDAAAARLPHGEYVYWPDDTHWNAAGIELAARQIAREMRQAEKEARFAQRD